jgi:hypothetical protein
MSIAELPLAIDPEAVAAFCRDRGIRKLSLFGSVLRDDFDPARSDVDVLVEYEPHVRPSWDVFEHAWDLGHLLGRKADMNTPGMLNHRFSDHVLRTAMLVFDCRNKRHLAEAQSARSYG